MSSRYKILSFHITAWLLYLLILLLGTDKPGLNFWINTASTIIPIIILFYLNISVLFPKYLQHRKFILLTCLLVVVNFGAIGLRLLLVTLLQNNSLDNFLNNFFSPVIFWNQFRVNLLFIGISFAYWYATKNFKAEKNQQRLEREILDARLSALKNQINPHFLHNTLSLIYTKSLPYSPSLADAIARLSDMMRYSLGEVEEDGKVPLEKEIAHIRNYIEIQQMRFDNTLNVSFEPRGNSCQCRIMPLLLITFVENAFKHGELNNANHPLLINLDVLDNYMLFTIQNRKASWKKEPAHGIGLQNVRNRLRLAYPQLYDLVIDDTTDTFVVKLKLAIQ